MVVRDAAVRVVAVVNAEAGGVLERVGMVAYSCRRSGRQRDCTGLPVGAQSLPSQPAHPTQKAGANARRTILTVLAGLVPAICARVAVEPCALVGGPTVKG